MTERDIVNELLTTHPGAPATSGVVLLLRTEMQYEFKMVRQEMSAMKADIAELKQDVSVLKQDVKELKQDMVWVKQEFTKVHSALDLLAQQVGFLVERAKRE